MNYAGKFDATIAADGPGTHHSPAYVHFDSPHAKIPPDAIVVTDAHLLFNADFKRSGVDLILSKDDAELVLHDYFKGEKRAPLASPDGAHLTGDLVNALTGHVQYSQAGGAAAASHVIGHVTKLAGSATAIRNGVSILLHQGDNVEKGDVVQSGADSTLGITFIDGTVFGLSSNARMVLNEMVYDPNGSNNASLMSLVAGTISFVAGETAKHGDMKVDTPVATMGIRGTAVLVEIDFTVPQGASQPDAKFQVLVEPDGTTGSYILFDKTTLQPIAVVNQAGQQVSINNGVVSTSASQLSPDLQKLITDVFQQKFAANDSNTKLTQHTDSTNPDLFNGQLIKTASGATATPVFLVTGTALGSSTPPGQGNGPLSGLQHVDQAPVVTVGSGTTNEILKTTHSTTPDLASNIITFNDINVGDQPTATTTFDNYTYTDAHGNAMAANPLQLADVKATEVNLVVVQGPDNTNTGQASWTYLVPDKAFDFLAAGETLTLTYIAEVDSNYAPNNLKTLVPFTITVTGTNDVPVITTDKVVQTITFSGGTSTGGGPLISGDATSGKFAFTDADLTDTHTVTAALTGWKMSDGSDLPPGPLDAFKAALTASIVEPQDDSTGTGTGAISWQFADLPAYDADFIPIGQTLTLTYTVTLTDSQGATDTKTVEVTITGTDHAAEVWIHTMGDGSPDGSPGGLWSTAQNWETRLVPKATDDVIIITDQLHGLTPSYPVTIDALTSAVAQSVTMNDFDVPNPPDPLRQAPELDILSGGSLTIGGAPPTGSTLPTDGTLTLGADSILHNLGTINVGGKAEFVDQSVLKNSGTMKLALGGDFKDQSSITNTGTGIIDVTGGTLNVLVDVANSGHVTVESGATLALIDGAIDGGTVTVYGTLDLEGTSFLKNGTLQNNGTIDVTGAAVTFNSETVSNSGAIEIFAGGSLTLDPTTVDNAGGTMKVDATATLILDGATITGGIVTDNGTVHVTAGSRIDGATMTAGQVTVDLDTTLTLDGTTITGGTIIDNGTVNVDATNTLKLSGVALSGGAISNLGTLEITGSGSIENDAFANAGGTLLVDALQTLTIDETTIADGTLTNHGTIDSTGDSAIDNANIVNSGIIESTGGTLTIDPALPVTLINSGTLEANGGELDITDEPVTNTGTLQAINNSKLKLTSTTVTNTGGQVKVASGSSLDLTSASITGGGTLTNAGALTNLSGINTIAAAVTNTGTIELAAGLLDLSGGLSGVGTLIIDDGTTLELGGATAQTITFAGGSNTLQLDNLLGFFGTISGVASTGGTFTITGPGNIITAVGDALDFTASGGTAGNHANMTLTLGGTLTGAANGIVVIQNGVGDITLDPSGNITGLAGDGIIAEDSVTGSGNIVVDATGSVTGTGLGSIGILAQNLNAANKGNISVTALGGASGSAYGIEALTQGNGDITVESAGNVTATGQYGIRVVSSGTGSETVTTDAGSNVVSGGTGLNIVNIDSAIAASAHSTISVTSYGTIHSGTTNNNDGTVAGGIYAGYRGVGAPTVPTADPNVNGTVLVANHANITADAGYGIDAYNWGNGNVTVNDGAGTTISAAQIGIGAFALSGGTGNVAVTVDANAMITGASYYGIDAFSTDVGNISVSISSGDVITSGSSGILAVNQATSIPGAAQSTISVTANGIIHSGATPNQSGTTPAGILAGYNPGAAEIANNGVAGSVLVQSNATIIADAGFGIEAFDWGTGDVTVTTGAASSITAAGTAIGAFALDGGKVSVTNEGTATGATGLSVNANHAGTITIVNDGHISGGADGIDVSQITPGSTGSTTITNTGTITGAGTSIAINENAVGTATIENKAGGIIGPATVSASTHAIDESGGDITIDNAGVINGTINVGNATFTNEASATWNVGGASGFGFQSTTGVAVSSTIDNAGIINLTDSAVISGANVLQIINSGTIDGQSGSTTIDAHITNTGTIESTGGTLTLDPVDTVSLTNSGLVEADGGELDITGEPVTNTGTLRAIDDSVLKLTSTTVTNAGGTVSVESGSTLDLANTTLNGGTLAISGTLDSTGTGAIDCASINNSSLLEATAGTLTIDAASIVTNTGIIEANGGNLIVDTAVSGSLEIFGASLLELGAASAYAAANVAFAAGSTGTLKLDHSETFGGTVSGLDDNKLDLGDITSGSNTTVTFAGDASGGTLTVVNNSDPTQVAHIKLTGDYLGVHWVTSSDAVNGGTDVTEVPGSIAGLNSLGNAVEGVAVTASITDGGQIVTNATYQWQRDGQDIAGATNASYTPTENDEGHVLTVKLGFVDALHQLETSTASAGTVQESPTENASISLSGLTSGNAVEGQQITASVTETDAPATGITYTWTVGGVAVKTGTDAAGATCTPSEADEGKTISVAVTFTDTHGFAEHGSTSAGTVQESPTENASISLSGLTSGNAVEGQQITASVTETDAPATGSIIYTWKAGGTTVASGLGVNTYTPTETDEGKTISVAVTFTDTNGFAESGTTSAGTVQESPTENASISLSGLIGGNAVEGRLVTATVTESDAPASGSIIYTWKAGGTTVASGLGVNTYTPTETDEGKALTVSVSFADTHGFAESGTTSAGTVQESATENASISLSGLISGNAVEGRLVTATVTESDAPASGSIIYTWKAGGTTVASGLGVNTYTPTETDEGKALTVSVSFADTHGFAESGTTSAGTVQESATGDLVATLDTTTAQPGVAIHVTGVTDGGIAVTTGLSYAWQHSSDNGQHWTTVGTNSSYTPGESDEGKLLQLVVTYAEASGTESATYSLGMPNDLVATLDGTIAEQGLTIHVTGVTDGGSAVSRGVSYAWQLSSDNGQHWTTVSSDSSYTPGATVVGELLQVVVNYVDSGENESTTDSLGIIAPDLVWKGDAHEWQTPGQWSPSGVPTSSDNALVDVSGTYKITVDQASSVAHSLVVNDSGATVEIVEGGALTLGGNLTIQAGKFQIDSGGILKDIAATATITGAFTDNGTVEAGGGTLEIASTAISGAGKFKIDAGATLQLDHADSLNVAFTTSGTLVLKDPANFHGTISDSGGSLTATDVIDLAGFDTSAKVTYAGDISGGTVTVSEAGTSVTLKVGANSTHWNTLVSDGHGGILIHDPPDASAPTADGGAAPASGSLAVGGVVAIDPGPAPSTIVANAPNQTLTGSSASDTFVFNFIDVGHNTVTNFHPDTDTLQFSGTIFANPQAALNATQDDGHGNTVVALDAHDTITLTAVLKAQLHTADFHFV